MVIWRVSVHAETGAGSCHVGLYCAMAVMQQPCIIRDAGTAPVAARAIKTGHTYIQLVCVPWSKAFVWQMSHFQMLVLC